MIVTIVTVHPTVTMVTSSQGTSEIPTAWFPTMPKVGQQWSVTLTHQPTNAEQLDQLNAYLVRD